MTSRFDAAIFDFDETMVNLERQHHDAYATLCSRLGCSYSDVPVAIRNRSGMRVIDEISGLRDFFGWVNPLDELVGLRAEIFESLLVESSIELLPGVAELITKLSDRGLLLAVTSSGMRSYIEMLLGRLELRSSFSRIVAGDEVSKAKPDPEPYLTTARLLSVRAAACVVFEDSEPGVLSAKRAGMYCVAVTNLYPREPQDLSAADLVVNTLAQVDVEWLLEGAAGSFRCDSHCV